MSTSPHVSDVECACSLAFELRLTLHRTFGSDRPVREGVPAPRRRDGGVQAYPSLSYSAGCVFFWKWERE